MVKFFIYGVVEFAGRV